MRAPDFIESPEDGRDRFDDGLVRAQDHVSVVVVKSDGQTLAQLTLGGLVAEPAVRLPRMRCNSASLIVP